MGSLSERLSRLPPKAKVTYYLAKTMYIVNAELKSTGLMVGELSESRGVGVATVFLSSFLINGMLPFLTGIWALHFVNFAQKSINKTIEKTEVMSKVE